MVLAWTRAYRNAPGKSDIDPIPVGKRYRQGQSPEELAWTIEILRFQQGQRVHGCLIVTRQCGGCLPVHPGTVTLNGVGGSGARLALIGIAVAASLACADTLTWKDGHSSRGRILGQFRDVVFVQVDSEPARFVRRSELEDARGASGEAIPPSNAPSPALAITNPVGEVRVEPSSGQATTVTDFAFVYPRDRIVTSDTGIARLVLLSSAVLKLGPSTNLEVRDSSGLADALRLERGQLFVEPTATRGVDVQLSPDLHVTSREGSVSLEQIGTSLQLTTYSGTALIESPGARGTIGPGHSIRIDSTDQGTTLLSERANADAIELTVAGAPRSLKPGERVVISSAPSRASRTTGSWRLTSMKGGVLLLGRDRKWKAVLQKDMDQVRLDAGDSIATEANSEAMLAREDGATLSLRESSELHLEAREIMLAAGAVKVEALREVVPLALPVGESRFTFVTVEARRPAREATALELATLAGEAKLSLPASLATIPARVRVRLDGKDEEATVQAVEGTTTVATAAQAEIGDPDVSVAVEAPRLVSVRALRAQGVRLGLNGTRTIMAGPEAVNARVRWIGDSPRIVFSKGPDCALEKDVTVALGSDKAWPLLRLENDARITLVDASIRATLGPSGRLRLGDETSVIARNAVRFTLHGPEGLAGAVLGARQGDRFEVPHRATVSVGRRGKESTSFKLDDGRALIVEDGAPPVQARLGSSPRPSSSELKGDAGDPATLSLTMPGAAPLAIAATRRVTVLATRQGEFIILDDPALLEAMAERGFVPLATTAPGSSFILYPNPNHLPELSGQPPPASPVR
jgi:hypothetical protein